MKKRTKLEEANSYQGGSFVPRKLDRERLASIPSKLGCLLLSPSSLINPILSPFAFIREQRNKKENAPNTQMNRGKKKKRIRHRINKKFRKKKKYSVNQKLPDSKKEKQKRGVTDQDSSTATVNSHMHLRSSSIWLKKSRQIHATGTNPHTHN